MSQLSNVEDLLMILCLYTTNNELFKKLGITVTYDKKYDKIPGIKQKLIKSIEEQRENLILSTLERRKNVRNV
jgi:hypothetical protein